MSAATGRTVVSVDWLGFGGGVGLSTLFGALFRFSPMAAVIGLAILAGQQFNSNIGQTIIMVVMTATFLMEIVGPMCVKYGVKKAGEVGMNVTEDDLIKSYKVCDVMDAEPARITEDTPLHQILDVFSIISE